MHLSWITSFFFFYFYKWGSSSAIVVFLLLCEEIHSSNGILVHLPYTLCKIFTSAFIPLTNWYHQWPIFTGEFLSAYEHAPGVPKQNGKQTSTAPTLSQTHTLATTPFPSSLFTGKKNALSKSSFVLDFILKPFQLCLAPLHPPPPTPKILHRNCFCLIYILTMLQFLFWDHLHNFWLAFWYLF